MESDVQTCVPIFMGIFVLVIIFFTLAVTVLTVIAFCKIFSKAGYSWALGLLVLVPLGNVIMPLILGFCDWPILKQLREFKKPQANINS